MIRPLVFHHISLALTACRPVTCYLLQKIRKNDVLRRCTQAAAYRETIISKASMAVQDGSIYRKGDQATSVLKPQGRISLISQ